jgi:hypothetical protein
LCKRQLSRPDGPVPTVLANGTVDDTEDAFLVPSALRGQLQAIVSLPSVHPFVKVPMEPLSFPLDAAPPSHATELKPLFFSLCELYSSPRADALEEVSSRKWIQVLAFLIGVPDAPTPPINVLRLVIASGLLVPVNAQGSKAFESQMEESKRGEVATAAIDVDAAVACKRLHLSPRGYRFLLSDTEHQVWMLLRHIAESRFQGGLTPERFVRLLMQLSHCAVGRAIPLACLPDAEQAFLSDLETLGVVHLDGPGPAMARCVTALEQAKLGASRSVDTYCNSLIAAASSLASSEVDRFYVSSLASALLAHTETTGAEGTFRSVGLEHFAAMSAAGKRSLTAEGWSGGLEGQAFSKSKAEADAEAVAMSTSKASRVHESVGVKMFVERNFRIYAETTEMVHAYLLGECSCCQTPDNRSLAVAALFAEVEYRLPLMIIARLTRSSIGKALDLGMDAVLIRSYLDRHAHPKARSTGVGVPDNVKDQIYLWEQERNRLVATESVMLSATTPPTPTSEREWEFTVDFLVKNDGVLFRDDSRRVVVAPLAAFDKLRTAIGEWRRAAQWGCSIWGALS